MNNISYPSQTLELIRKIRNTWEETMTQQSIMVIVWKCFICVLTVLNTHTPYHLQTWWHALLISWEITVASFSVSSLFFFFQGKRKGDSYAGTFQWLCPSAANHFLIMLQVPPLIVAAAAGFYKLGQSQESSRLLKHQTCSGVLSCEREHQIRKRDSARDNRSAPLYSHEEPLCSVYLAILLDAFSDL